ncbi:MAG: FAD:protein FMN transferase [Mucinivorans sp.]
MKKYIIIALLVWGCVACSGSLKYQTITGFAQGTTYRITYAEAEGKNLQDTIERFLARFDSSLSIYERGSLILRLNDNSTTVVDEWFKECFADYKLIYKASEGLLDPTLRPLIAIYGFGGKSSAPRTPSESEIDSIMCFVGLDKVTLRGDTLVKQDSRTELDFNALAQGYSSDLVARMFDDMGIENYMVEIGGEVFARGVNPSGGKWRIGIDVPEEGNNTPGAKLQGVIELSGRGLATSGNYRKIAHDERGALLTHTIDPRTARPAVHNLLSATIIAPSAAMADGYATAAMVGGLEWTKALLSSHEELDALLIYAGSGGEFLTYSTLGR